MNTFEIPWYVVYTYPKQERRIFEDLTEQNINAFFPCQKVVKQWSDRKKKLSVPLFPNYVFVQISLRDRFKVFNVPGITRFISVDGLPSAVPQKEITTIKRLLDEDVSIENEEFYETGENVRVTQGPFAGMVGVLLEKKGGRRFGIRFGSIAQAISVDIQSSFLEKVDAL
ncbi:UpxY family transcription antiterminator [Chryseolinea lacunae]|uniref:UpxY family transcription antiterminator n=1 Tax=Chryseolinea lacunae TaxID=2801331 RepID=A0ABS1KPH4_9BACT|nr:UpxY family transcription antiterminator [Chryseolinea lacunae]MBL0741378.1 UpxY family transcription antiterminator [Chryseolinea lacunae]